MYNYYSFQSPKRKIVVHKVGLRFVSGFGYTYLNKLCHYKMQTRKSCLGLITAYSYMVTVMKYS